MTQESVYSVVVWTRSSHRLPWREWRYFPSGVAAAIAIREAKACGDLRTETLTIFNGSDPNKMHIRGI